MTEAFPLVRPGAKEHGSTICCSGDSARGCGNPLQGLYAIAASCLYPMRFMPRESSSSRVLGSVKI